MKEGTPEKQRVVIAVIHACPAVRAQIRSALRSSGRRVLTAAHSEELGPLAKLVRESGLTARETDRGHAREVPPSRPESAPQPGIVMPYAVDEHGNGISIDPSRGAMEESLALLGSSGDFEQQPEVLSGGLAEIPFADLVTWLRIGRLTGSVRVAGTGNLARLYLEEGAVCAAELDTGETGEEAIERVLGWTEGSFDVLFGGAGGFAQPAVH